MNLPLQQLATIFSSLVTRRVHLECDQIPLVLEEVPYRKIINWLGVEFSARFHPRRPLFLPTHLQVEASAHCNLSCPLCPVSQGLGRPAGHMSLELFQHIIRQSSRHLFLVQLWDWGEPFLNPAIYQMISCAKSHGISVVASSNGQVFASRAQAEKVVQSGLDALILAVDGADQASYEQYRVGGSLSRVLQGITNIVEARENLCSATPAINMRMIAMRQNEKMIPQLQELARKLAVDYFSVRTLNSFDLTTDHTEFTPSNPALKRFTYRHDQRIPVNSNPCKRLWNNPTIHWDGTVCQCSFDPHGQYPLGNINHTPLRQIWQGQAYQQLRTQFRRQSGELPLCSQCKYAYQGPNQSFTVDCTAIARKKGD